MLAAMWIRRLSRERSSDTGKGQRVVRGMPQRLVCGACGKEYEPLTNGWLCPQCHR
jgi:Zn finger protein HypA/HybF involved in hydrogenase expression